MGKEVIRLYLGGMSFKEIAEQTGNTYQKVYNVVYRQVQMGKLRPRRKSDETIRRNIESTIKYGHIGKAVKNLSTVEMARLAGKVKRGETLSEALVRIALSR